MSIEWSKGDIFITMGDETVPFCSGVPFTEEIELSAKENPTRLYRFNDTLSCSLEVNNVDLSKLNDTFGLMPNKNFIMEADVNIMVQARWHKKPRIRKKWLKRFGMKPDTVKIRMDAKTGEYHINDGSFDFETDKYEYVWRPDQMRRGLKIEL